jgi:hypothetical protein
VIESMSQRPLSTYGLPVATLALLSRAGYTTAAELTNTSADALAAGPPPSSFFRSQRCSRLHVYIKN